MAIGKICHGASPAPVYDFTELEKEASGEDLVGGVDMSKAEGEEFRVFLNVYEGMTKGTAFALYRCPKCGGAMGWDRAKSQRAGREVLECVGCGHVVSEEQMEILERAIQEGATAK